MQQTFWEKYKVLVIGLMSAVAVAITPFVQNGNPGELVKWSTVGYAVLIAVLSFLGNAWRGQGLTIFGIVGTGMGTAASLLLQGSHVNVSMFIMQLVLQTFVGVIAAVGSDPKSKGYEHTEVIKQAKKEGEVIQPAKLTTKPK